LPSARVNRLNNTIAVVEEILTQAKANCTRDYLALVAAETRFLRLVSSLSVQVQS
jgi:hypothetical protein